MSSNCNWCHSHDVHLRAHGAVAPWILLTQPDERGLTALWECRTCGLNFFTRNFSPSELDQLYGEYRGQQYFERRHHWEPWYSKEVNSAIGHNTETVIHRRRHLEGFVAAYIQKYHLTPRTSVVDFGGDEGQFIPESESILRRGVFEVSDSKPVPGVQRLANWDEVEAFVPDLMMVCHVLEHTTDAREIVDKAYRALQAGSMIYIEVPLDRPPKPSRLFRTNFYRSYTKWVYRSRYRWVSLDFLALVSKRYLNRLLPGAIVKQNEHIQFFDQASIRRVLRQIGFSNIECSEYVASGDIPRLKTNALGVLAWKPN